MGWSAAQGLYNRLARAVPYILIMPAVAYLMIFIGYPILDSLYLAFFEGGSSAFSNVDYLLNSPNSRFKEALLYTLLLAAVVVPVETILALAITLFLFNRFRGRDSLVYVLAIPLAISDVAAGLIWYTLLTGGGFINKLLLNIGVIDNPVIIFGYQNRLLVFAAIVVAEVWRSMAIVFIILFAGAQLINREVLEAAEVFGAGFLIKLRHILIPMLKPSLQSALIIRTLFAFQVFAVVWVLAGRDIPVLAGETYYTLTELKLFGVAALYALIIASLSLAMGLLYLRLLKARFLEAEA